MFRDNVSVPSSRVEDPEEKKIPESVDIINIAAEA
jgi:hypothetical protein